MKTAPATDLRPIVSNEKIEATGWRPDHGLAAGVRELVKGYRMLRNGRFSNV